MASSGTRPKVPQGRFTHGRSWRENDECKTDHRPLDSMASSGTRPKVPQGRFTHGRSWRENDECKTDHRPPLDWDTHEPPYSDQARFRRGMPNNSTSSNPGTYHDNMTSYHQFQSHYSPKHTNHRGSYHDKSYSPRGSYQDTPPRDHGNYRNNTSNQRGSYHDKSYSHLGSYQDTPHMDHGNYRNNTSNQRGRYHDKSYSHRGSYQDMSPHMDHGNYRNNTSNQRDRYQANWRSSTDKPTQASYDNNPTSTHRSFNSSERRDHRPYQEAQRLNESQVQHRDSIGNAGSFGESNRRGRGGYTRRDGERGTQRPFSRAPNFQGRSMKTLDVKTLTHLLTLTPKEIVMQLGDENSGCEQLLKQQDITEQVRLLLLKVLAKACQCTSSQMLLNSLLVMVLNSSYLTKHMQQLIISLQTSKHDDDKGDSLQTTVNEALALMHALLQHIPSSCSEVGVLVLLLENAVKRKDNKDESYQDILTRLTDMKDLYHTLVTDESDKVKRSVLKAHYKPPPNDFRKIPLLPESEELRKDQQPFLRQNLTSGKYIDAHHYLDVQYRLLREDFVAPLREGISDYLNQQSNPDENKHHRLADMRLYTKVHILNPVVGRDGIGHTLKFDTNPLSRVRWEQSKRLLPSSLVCLTKDDFHTVIFAIVDKRDAQELAAGRLIVRFNRLSDIIAIKPNETFLMAETTAYFEQYRPVLLGLQEMGQQDLYGNTPSIPMERYIVSVAWNINRPSYISDETTAVYDLRHLTWDQGHHDPPDCLVTLSEDSPSDSLSDSLSEDSDNHSIDVEYEGLQLDSERVKEIETIKRAKARWVPLLETGDWPTAETLHLDESQLTAFQNALTKEFALIQGPPGTGKTYVGLKIVETLLFNRHAWSTTAGVKEDTIDHRPILVVCYTNHALDQFLEGIYEFEKQVIRIGGRSSSEIMKDRNLNMLRRQRGFHNRRVFQDYDRLQKVLENAQFRLELAHQGILTEFSLRQYMNKDHFNSLTDLWNQPRDKKRVEETFMMEWLGLARHGLTREQHSKKERCTLQMKRNVDDGSIDVLGEAELIAQLRQMEEDDPVMMADQRARKEAILEELAFAVGFSEPDHYERWATVKFTELESIVTNEVGRPRDVFSDQDASNVVNVWMLEPWYRWSLYRYWLARYVKAQKNTLCESQAIYQRLSQQQKEFDLDEDEKILQEGKVIGMTTTGAARNRLLLQRIKPRIIIVEEAAEVLEAHIITTLSDECKHLILIGDHQQLRPNPTVYRLAKQFKLDVSLFERMINNRIPCQQLTSQHRMRPEISILMKRHFYKNLDDHQSVLKYDNIHGVSHSVFFVQHDELENEVEDIRSKSNTHEALFMVRLCRYFLQQGYAPSQITILTTYTGQLLNLKEKMDKDTFDGVQVCVVDNYQGEENDIILLSLVRSNDEGNVGFLKVDNRICVALSRAKKGLFCIGNLQLLAERSQLWRGIIETLSENQHTGPQLPLVCLNHSNVTNVACGDDFNSVPDGGCSLPCEYRLQCGHVCVKSCHPLNQQHKDYICLKPCARRCIRDHPCKLQCKENCKCMEIVEKTMEECGHAQAVPCHSFETWKCKEPCEKKLKCCHICPEKCGSTCISYIACRQPCTKMCSRDHPCQQMCSNMCRCEVTVTKTMAGCGHEQKMPCHSYDSWKCKEPCEKTLECGHACRDKCGQRCEGSYCKEPCEKTLECGHPCLKECGRPCKLSRCIKPCEKNLPCGHKCKKRCFETCAGSGYNALFGRSSCIEEVEITLPDCAHKAKVLCSDNPETMTTRIALYRRKPSYPVCIEKCSKLLVCGHKCENKCSDHCTTQCTTNVDTTLECGHQMTSPCYKVDNAICTSICDKKLPCGHTCQEPCKNSCKCKQLVEKILPGCGHTQQMECHADPEEATCTNICSKTQPCGHICKKLCRDSCRCFEKVEETLSECGHKVEITCGSGVQNIICQSQCSKLLPCTHLCKNKCSEPCVLQCKKKTEQVLECGHKKVAECWIDKKDVKCMKKCSKKLQCGHACQESCRNPCTVKCQVKKRVKMPTCHHAMSIKCHQDIKDVKCTAPCKKKLKCGHKCGNSCGEPCEINCQKKKEKTMESCNHRQTIPCYLDVKDHICQVPCKKQLGCRHNCVKLCGETCKCGISKRKKMPKCRHMQMIECGVTTSNHVCQEKCRKMYPCGHTCMKGCGEPCESQCQLEKEKTLPGCKHKQVVPCRVHPKDVKCTARCKRRLSCSHPCNQQCGVPCTEKCTFMMTKDIPDCKHRIQLICSDDITKVACQEKCRRKLKCGHVCQNKCTDACTQNCCVMVWKKLNNCSHKKMLPCSEDVADVVCEDKCSKKMTCGHKCVMACGEPCKCDGKCRRNLSCGHRCQEQCDEPCTKVCKIKVQKIIEDCGHATKQSFECYKEPTHEDCDSVCAKPLDCGHLCQDPCNECSNGHHRGVDRKSLDEEKLHQTCHVKCEALLQCGHKCRSECTKCFGGRIHGPCMEECQKILLCGCKCERQCVQRCRCLRSTYSQCPSLYNRTSIRQNHSTCNHSPTSLWCSEPCKKKIRCGHRCIGLCGETCILLCRYCHRDKVLAIFPEYTVKKDPCYISLSPCNHIAEVQSVMVQFDDSQSYSVVKPPSCPQCGHMVSNERFASVTTEWRADVKAIKQIIKEKEEDFLKEGKRLLQKRKKLTDNSNFINAKVWIHEIKMAKDILAQRLEKLKVDVEDKYGIGTESGLLLTEVRKVVRQSILHTLPKSSVCTNQMIDDITGELSRVGCCCELLETLGSPSNQTCSEEYISTATTKIMKLISPPGSFTVQRYKDVQKGLDDLYGELVGTDAKRTPVLISMPAKSKLNPPMFHMGEWFKCKRSGHYFCRSECNQPEDGGDMVLKCPECAGTEEVDSSDSDPSVKAV